MRARELTIDGAAEFSIPCFPDDRGMFASPYLGSAFTGEFGGRPFSLAQNSLSVSHRDVARGMHYTAAPPGNAKYVYCVHGKATDIILDVRAGSPTFGRWETIELDPADFRAVYVPVGVAHGFVSHTDGTIMNYLMSTEYVREDERAVHPLDPALGLPIPAASIPLLSDRDRLAPTLAEAGSAGLLPRYEHCLAIEAAQCAGTATR
ncbi:dTDP-4-dehydrorhamnose 3,5-epimerase [Amycolatopsis sp. NPDC051716]|jgi:epimerase EvaD|uniref:dTDP-4-dehydrorhamnose 3,5-epimerase family protein n=1 Tax=Amycolatopsis sp. NPDC051716 TaxID=3155804 RepID=UPI00341D832B